MRRFVLTVTLVTLVLIGCKKKENVACGRVFDGDDAEHDGNHLHRYRHNVDRIVVLHRGTFARFVLCWRSHRAEAAGVRRHVVGFLDSR